MKDTAVTNFGNTSLRLKRKQTSHSVTGADWLRRQGLGVPGRSHGVFLNAWNELLGIRIQPAVDLVDRKKKTQGQDNSSCFLMLSGDVTENTSCPLIGQSLDSPLQCQSLHPGGCPGEAPVGQPAPAAEGVGPWRG